MAENRGHRLWPRQNKKRGYNGKISGVKSSRIKSTLELLGCDQYPHSLFKNKHYSTLTDEPFQFLVYYEQREGREWGGVQYLTTKICSRKRFLSPTSLQDISFKSSPCIRCGNGFAGFVFFCFAPLRYKIEWSMDKLLLLQSVSSSQADLRRSFLFSTWDFFYNLINQLFFLKRIKF